MGEIIAKVRLLDVPFSLDRPYDYTVPRDFEDKVKAGCFVTIPFGGGNRRYMGLVEGLAPSSAHGTEKLKKIQDLPTPHVSLSEEMLGLLCFLREHTLATTGDVVHAMIPAGALSALTERYYATSRPVGDVGRLSDEEAAILGVLRDAGEKGMRGTELRHCFRLSHEAEALAHLLRRGLIRREMTDEAPMAEKYLTCFSLAVPTETALLYFEGKGEGRPLGEKQRRVLSILADGERNADELRGMGLSKTQTDSLEARGLIKSRRVRVFRGVGGAFEDTGLPLDFTLNEEQEEVLSRLSELAFSGKPQGVLLHGVTGSGKTLVLLRLIDEMLEMGKGVIVLLPEIALTPQTLSIFSSRYGERVAVLHSALSSGERLDTYDRIKSGKADVVVGTRSAVFAPVKNLGLIAIDEEHEHTYKSDMNPKYHARDVARYRAAYCKGMMLLMSATPSLESYKKAMEGKYTLLSLNHRHGGAVLPAVTLADMRKETGGGALSPLGETLLAALSETMDKGEQAVLFLNRRGYHHTVTCRSCGEALTCPTCSVSLTYHTGKGQYERGYLSCHFCGKRFPMPAVCPACGSPHLAKMGYGTQRVEEELTKAFPRKKVLRMDADSTGSRSSYDEMLGAFRRHEADILLGTQMVTKGHDFPDVTLVGVLMADAALYLDDYRAGERTFSLLTQVVGRAGRAEKSGRAVIQTNNPENDVIALACRQDYKAFYEREIRLRRLLVFPPFCDIALLTVSHEDERAVMAAAGSLAKALETLLKQDFSDVKLIVYGPFEAPVYRAENRYRLRLVMKCALNARTRELFRTLLMQKEFSRGMTAVSIDFNPSSL